MAWKETAGAKAIDLDLMIKEMVKKNKIPTQLVKPINHISMISSDIESLGAIHKANLKPLVHQASGLIIVLWRLYLRDRYRRLWPLPPLNWTVDKFVKTVDSIRKLLARKCEKSFVKKKIFLLLDLGKVKKCLCKLDAAATNIEEDPRHAVDVNAELLEAINEYNNPQDEEAQLLEVRVKDIIPEPVVEDSRQQEAERSSVAETASQELKAIEEEREVEMSTRASRETLKTQSSQPTPSINNAGSIEEDHEVETSIPASRQSSSPPSPQHRMFNASFNNTGSGVMINQNIGNVYNAAYSNIGNNNFVPHHWGRHHR